MELTKYRICQNKYGWVKIQRFVYCDVPSKEMTIIDVLLMYLTFGFYQPKKWQWVDTFDYKKYQSEQEALDRIKFLRKDEVRIFELNHNSFECGGEV